MDVKLKIIKSKVIVNRDHSISLLIIAKVDGGEEHNQVRIFHLDVQELNKNNVMNESGPESTMYVSYGSGGYDRVDRIDFSADFDWKVMIAG